MDSPLDPELFSAERFRALGHDVIDQLADWLTECHTGAGPVLPPGTPDAVRARFPSAFPEPGATAHGVIARALHDAIRVASPRFVGHQVASPLPLAALADLVAALTNNGMAVFEMGKSGTAMERAVLAFFARALGFPDTADGVLTSGGSLGNLTALLAARQARGGRDVWRQGTPPAPRLEVAVAASAHYSVARAVRIMGLGDRGVRAVPVDDRQRMTPEALDAALTAAKGEGARVFAVVAQAGSTAVGALDPIDELADVAAAHGAWLHVDGAHGGPLVLSPRRRAALRGIERADSVVIDAHKMMMMPALVTAVLFRDGKDGAAAFAQDASYLFVDDDERWADVGRRTVECTKRMMALKLFLPLTVHGPELFARHVERMCALAEELATAVTARPALELFGAPMTNIICFRARDRDSGVQAAIRRKIVDDGRFYLVQVRIDGALWLRTVILNPLTTSEDLAALLDEVERAAVEVTAARG